MLTLSRKRDNVYCYSDGLDKLRFHSQLNALSLCLMQKIKLAINWGICIADVMASGIVIGIAKIIFVGTIAFLA